MEGFIDLLNQVLQSCTTKFFFPLLFCETKGTWLPNSDLRCAHLVKLSVVDTTQRLSAGHAVYWSSKRQQSLGHFRFVIGIHISCSTSTFLWLFVESCHTVYSFFFFFFFSAADKVIVPHLQRTSSLHDGFYYYVVEMFYIAEMLSVLISQSVSVLRRRVPATFHLLLLFYYSNLYVFYMYCENVLFYHNSFFLFLFFWSLKTNVSHEYFMRNKRKYLLIIQCLRSVFCCHYWIIVNMIPCWLVCHNPLNILTLLLSTNS